MSKIKTFITNHFNIFAFIMFAVIVFSLYGKAVFFDWSYLDDDTLIVERENYLNVSNIKNIFFDTIFGEKDITYRPILSISFLLDHCLYGTNPHGYHLTNIFIFIFSIFVIFLLFSYNSKKNLILFGVVAILAVHPILNNIVAWIPGRNDSLLTLFAVVSFYFFLLYIKSKKNFYFIVHLLSLSLCFFTKETALVLPIIYCLFYFSLYKANKNKIYIFIVFWLICYILFFYCRYCAISKYGYNDIGYIDIIKAITSNFYILFVYFYNIFFPITIHLNNIVHFALFLLSILIFLLILKNKYHCLNKNLLVTCLASFILLIMPTIIVNSNLYSCNRLFLPMIFVVYILFDVIQKSNINKRLVYIIFLCYFSVFFVISFNSIDKFKNKWNYFVSLSQENPQNAFFNAKFASMLMDIGMYDEAITKYKKAIEIEPYNYKYYNDLGVVYIKQKKLQKAKEILLLAKNLKEDDENINYNLGLIENYVNE